MLTYNQQTWHYGHDNDPKTIGLYFWSLIKFRFQISYMTRQSHLLTTSSSIKFSLSFFSSSASDITTSSSPLIIFAMDTLWKWTQNICKQGEYFSSIWYVFEWTWSSKCLPDWPKLAGEDQSEGTQHVYSNHQNNPTFSDNQISLGWIRTCVFGVDKIVCQQGICTLCMCITLVSGYKDGGSPIISWE